MKKTILFLLVGVLLLNLSGCSKKSADETMPLDQVKAEAEKMDTSQLRTMALRYKDTIAAKQSELSGISEQIKAINPAELLGEKAKQLKAQMSDIEKSVSALKERFNIYYEQLKAKAGDLSGLEI